MFVEYRPPKHHIEYRRKFGKLSNLCKICGYPWGLHYGEKCPEKEGTAFLLDMDINPEFYKEMALLKVI